MDLKNVSKKAYDMSKCLPQIYFDEEDDEEGVEMPKGGKFSNSGSKVVLAFLERKKRQKVH